MARKTRTRSRGAAGSSRRGFLFKVGAGGIAAASLFVGLESTGAFSAVSSIRESNVAVDSGSSALIGIVGQGPVQKKKREAMVEFTNNTNVDITITVSLNDSSDGTLYDNEGDSGSSVTFTLGSGNSQTVDIKADVTGTIGYSVSVTSTAVNLNTIRSVDSEAGNAPGAVVFKKFKGFDSDLQNDEWTLQDIHIQDGDGDDDLDRVEYEITDESGNVVSSRTVDFNPPTGSYNPKGNPDETFKPDDSSYNLVSGENYTLAATAYDVDGNSDKETLTDTA